MYEFSDLVLLFGLGWLLCLLAGAAALLAAGAAISRAVLAGLELTRGASPLPLLRDSELGEPSVDLAKAFESPEGLQDARGTPLGDVPVTAQAHAMSHPSVVPAASTGLPEAHPAVHGPFRGSGCVFCGRVRSAARRAVNAFRAP